MEWTLGRDQRDGWSLSYSRRCDSGNTQQLIEAVPDHPWDQTRFEDVVLTLSPGITLKGRILKDGQPLEGVTMELSRSSHHESRSIPQIRRDEDGRGACYAVSGLARGDGYRFNIVAPDNALAARLAPSIAVRAEGPRRRSRCDRIARCSSAHAQPITTWHRGESRWQACPRDHRICIAGQRRDAQSPAGGATTLGRDR